VFVVTDAHQMVERDVIGTPGSRLVCWEGVPVHCGLAPVLNAQQVKERSRERNTEQSLGFAHRLISQRRVHSVTAAGLPESGLHILKACHDRDRRSRASRFGARPGMGRQNDHVSGRMRLREIDDDEGQRLLRILRRGTGSVVLWRRAQLVLLSAQDRGVRRRAG
jgi:hypothetical protein